MIQGHEQHIPRTLRYTLLLASFLVYSLIVLSGILRVTGSGLACPDWPLCHGALIPLGGWQVWLAWFHRLVTSLIGLALIAATALAWVQLTVSHPITRSLALTIPVLLVQAGLGGLAVIYRLPPGTVALHLALSLLILSFILRATVMAFEDRKERRPRHARFLHTLSLTLLLVYGVIVLGGFVTDTGAGTLCLGWPLCGGGGLGNPLVWLNWVHRGSVGLVFLLLIWLLGRVGSDPTLFRDAKVWLGVGIVFYVLNALAGALQEWGIFPRVMAASHLGLAASTWAALNLSMGRAYATNQGAAQQSERGRRAKRTSEPPMWRVYLSLMKPGIVTLLVVTTLAGMIIAARGWPGWPVFVWTMVASFLSAGGANALNSYHDRDIDGLMSRTARRPLPQGQVTARNALIFAVLNVVAGVLLMALFVNILSAFLMLVGAVWYAGLYTHWLKRSTVQNIVIGGAAGALAPVVGWTAVTGHVSALAGVLFALIFLWTPPHTWAFSLLVLKDYKRVGVPMLPLVHGVEVTTYQIVLYSWTMALATLVPVPLHLLGNTYLAGMVLLNGIFLYLAYQLRRHPEKSLANKLYQYSNAYLYLAFALMALDRMGGLL